MTFTPEQRDFLEENTRAIVHIRKRKSDSKLSLVVGAGISKDFGIPKWEELIENIAKDKQVNGLNLLRKNKNRLHASKTQVLFQYFAAKLSDKQRNLSEGEIKNTWRNIVRKHLYKKGKSIQNILRDHPYIESFIKIIKDSPMTVTYNFDSYIEEILQKKDEPIETRNYETVWDPRLQTKLNQCVIYHPNGFLPKRALEHQSEGLVFCEDEFADQLIETMAGHYASLLHHYSQKTCLFLGISLDDSTLKHLLRQSARLNPGHYHYYIAFQEKNNIISEREKEAIYDSNFNLYNLVTLFLTNDEIKTLGDLLTMDEKNFLNYAGSEKINLVFCYYIIGAIGVGKSSAISYFRNLATHDEWPDFRIAELGKDWTSLPKQKRRKVDQWIAEQFTKKNRTLNVATEGIHIVDRAPLDPIAFTQERSWHRKARFLIEKVCGNTISTKIKDGEIIFLTGDPKVLENRAKSHGKEYSARKLKKMEEALRKIYKFNDLRIINTRNRSSDYVVKDIARIIHKEKYSAKDLQGRITDIKDGQY